ncbi:Iron-sulfur cluster assembly scaffold protein IscU 2 [uncultured archaeon]|nr:Iron-sulfur cluster assembly scaffold protein IscU 2 [uncultured archaeon]
MKDSSLMYTEAILDHYKNPRNSGNIADAQIRQRGINPICGDDIELTLKVEADVVKDAKFTSNSCAISTASADMLLTKIKGKTIAQAESITSDDAVSALHIPISPARIKCAVLPLVTLKDGINSFKKKSKENKTSTTE